LGIFKKYVLGENIQNDLATLIKGKRIKEMKWSKVRE